MLAAVAAAVCTALLCACSGGATSASDTVKRSSTNTESAAQVEQHLGAVPIPTAPSQAPIEVATRTHPQLLAIGEPVKVQLPGVDALVTVLGPFEVTPSTGGSKPPQTTVGVITVKVAPTRGSLTLRAGDFLSRNEVGTVVPLLPKGASTVTASVGHPAQLQVKGTFQSGAAEITWNDAGKALCIWDFNIELD